MDLLRTRIDLGAIAHNTRLLKELVGAVRLMAVVKADGYNHGAVDVARTMLANGADALGVATLAEAHALREAGIRAPLLAWIWSPEQDFRAAIAADIELGIPTTAHAKALIDAAAPARVALKLDTGLHRSGLDETEWEPVFRALKTAEHLEVTGLFSHLASADDPADPETDRQAERFRSALNLARDIGLETPCNHLCNSPATLTRPDLHFQQVRVGLACYGLEPVPGLAHGLKPAMSWEASVAAIKPIAAGEGSSYGLTWRAAQDGQLALVPCGYADGLPRAAQGHLEVGINGQRYPQVGRVCMDQFVVDLGENPQEVSPGDTVTIFGEGGMSATELADGLGTINYEVVCRPTGRTVRTILEEN
ncbi:Alanine racemase [Corynebacterium occultum]|uniref:Alanine racemase n=1 Tax=Corynebacterium occultum TaxID=2675219 RepID=A0A6B8W559_9CORY|nr:alanine racemase [Corynebacterium occultum]QGU06485.1 Alanine racemase [Corynebacterium occultum]